MNKLIFTQDIPGEREWIEQHFPDHINLETINSSKWGVEYCPGSKYIYEISLSDNIWPDIPGEKIKSIFSNNNVNLLMQDKRWTITSDRIINFEFHRNSNVTHNNKFLAFTMGRSGTKFTEELLETQFIKFATHKGLCDFEGSLETVNKLSQNPIIIVLIYRKNWWEWLTSKFIANQIGYDNLNAQVDWTKVQPFNMTIDNLKHSYKISQDNWEFWCNLACSLPKHRIYLLEYSEIIGKYSNLVVKQKKMPYDKKQLISNYSEMKEIFINQYQQLFNRNQENCRQHLVAMGVETTLNSLNF
jgi:hypothetical protein